jgi:hypothetical protein
MSKYNTLINILDQLRKEAPPDYKSYHPLETDTDKLDKARSKAFIHLYLKAKFGLLDFLERESYITDGTYDGGIDAYYIDEEGKTIYFMQAKFRTTESNFESKEISLTEILNMDIDRITDGETTDENGNKYNGKIQALIRRLQNIPDIARYKYQVIILANLRKVKPSQLRKLVPGFPCVVFDFNRCYEDLVFPVISGTYYTASDLYININLTDKEYSSSRISYPVETEYTDCEITALFVPTLEIAKILHKYKNSILLYNPRSYLDLSTNPVNKEIARTITERATNEFSLFNNGITMLSDETRLQERAGKKNRGQLYVKNPKIINGGQTAYTLSRIYEDAIADGEHPEEIFGTKEVMLKVITFTEIDKADSESRLRLIEEISRATNRQTDIREADRRSNDKIQIDLQGKIFDEFGYFYERKRGEFFDGLRNKYVDQAKVIDRVEFLRAVYATLGFPAEARRNSENVLFRKSNFDKIISEVSRLPSMFFAYLCYNKLEDMARRFRNEPNNRFGVLNYGSALRYGRLAVIHIAHSLLDAEVTPSNVESLVDDSIDTVLSRWLVFEEFAKKQDRNYRRGYFRRVTDPTTGKETLETNFDGYYKGRTLNHDLARFFNLDA